MKNGFLSSKLIKKTHMKYGFFLYIQIKKKILYEWEKGY